VTPILVSKFPFSCSVARCRIVETITTRIFITLDYRGYSVINFRRIWFFCSVFNYRAIIFWTPGRIIDIFWAKLRRKGIVFSLIGPRRFLKQLASIFKGSFKLRGNASKWGKFEGSLYKMCYPQFVCNH